MNAPDAGALCQTCGLCCDGTFFSRVRVGDADAVEPLRAAGLIAQDAGPGSWFLQPCAALRDRRCQVYADRPSGCRTFECLTLQRLSAGEIDLERAREIIDQAHALKQDIRRAAEHADPSLANLSPEALARTLVGCTDVDVLMALAAFDRFAARHFMTITYGRFKELT